MPAKKKMKAKAKPMAKVAGSPFSPPACDSAKSLPKKKAKKKK